MVSRRVARAVFVAVLAVLLLPAVSFAQTRAIAGVVTDATGGVVPGVTVEAASPDHQQRYAETICPDQDGRRKSTILAPGRLERPRAAMRASVIGFSVARHRSQ